MQRGRFYVRNCGAGGARPPGHPGTLWGVLRHAADIGTAWAGPARYVYQRQGSAHPRDLENGLQPMQLDWKGETYVLVYNGELYNTSELRAALANRGHSFTGHSDTEVLLHAFAEWGTDCVERCNGIFAFAVWRVNAGTLFLYPGRGQPDFWKRTENPAGPPGSTAAHRRQRFG